MDGVDTSTLCSFVQGILSILEVGMHTERMTVWQPDMCRLNYKKGQSGYSGHMYSRGEWQRPHLGYNRHNYDVGVEVHK